MRWLIAGMALALIWSAAGLETFAKGKSHGGGSVSVSGGVSVASGRATYGYSRGHGGYWGGGGGYWGGYWGWPYYGWGWGWPYHRWGWYYSQGPAPVMYAAGINRSAPAALVTDIRPKKAEVRIDGELVGQARDYNGKWDQLWISPGEHEIEFSREGYQTLRLHVKTGPGGYHSIEQNLQKGTGLDPRSTERPARPEATQAAAPSETPRVDWGANQPRESLRSGFLRIDAQPTDAAIYLDGEFLASAAELGRLHGSLPIALGLHTVEVVRPGYSSRTMRVEVNGEEPVKVLIRLDREAPGSP